MKTLFCTILFLTSALGLFAQNMMMPNSSISFQGQNNTFFNLLVDGVRITPSPRNAAEMTAIVPGAHTFTFQILQPNGSYFNFRTSFFVEPGFVYAYSIEYNLWTGVSFLQNMRNPMPGTQPYNNYPNNNYPNNNPYNNYPYNNPNSMPPGQQFQDCMRFAMSDGDFETYLNAVRNKAGDQTKMSIAQQGLFRRQIRCNQVLQVMKIFSFESSRLDFAKFAFDYLCDPQNVYQLNDGFTFSSSVSDFEQFLRTKR